MGMTRIQSNFNESYGQLWDSYPILQSHLLIHGGFCDAEDQAANGANGKGEKPLIKKFFSKTRGIEVLNSKSQLITLASRTHTKGLATRTSGKSCFAKSHSHPVPQAGDWVSQGKYAAQLYIPNHPTPMKTRSMKTWVAVKKWFATSPLHLFDVGHRVVKCTDIGISRGRGTKSRILDHEVNDHVMFHVVFLSRGGTMLCSLGTPAKYVFSIWVFFYAPAGALIIVNIPLSACFIFP